MEQRISDSQAIMIYCGAWKRVTVFRIFH